MTVFDPCRMQAQDFLNRSAVSKSVRGPHPHHQRGSLDPTPAGLFFIANPMSAFDPLQTFVEAAIMRLRPGPAARLRLPCRFASIWKREFAEQEPSNGCSRHWAC
jgi:hypothetical protein